ncbi:UDP-3-O-(3-hydroxymyristoyl)glucosamine N-acyltransferase [Pacificibacter marinus]|uniref:UDP-3-O-acylglucosamine N-acyltransferase n=1 Tax=Pacificibacter marinus TaxID=658057 RepID=A0A1Y5TKX3_9RHOB|nr:UDP-3-O-(3-hydroxymyristoyl)glucosamine N-acyltransferase [Pacificibacter marinus]SEL26220.1 UDP-3-O-[3-hydroxymyristoyl] glucosamine N-acyltransferase [Pacificibacter marinus]SLN64458.1 UDP-3-O-acylglucosamine N-acyltransferase [Pacificibacter marinus]
MTGITLFDLAQRIGAPFEGNGDLIVTSASEPATAGETDLALAMDPKFAPDLAKGKARAAVLWDGADWQSLGLEAAIMVRRGRLAMAAITASFDAGLGLAPGIHPSAVIDPSAQIGADVRIGPLVVVGANAIIGARSQIAPQVSIGAFVQIGADAVIHSGVRIGARAQIGDRIYIQPGAVIGADGFSFVTQEKSAVEQARESLGAAVEAQGQSWLRIASIGGVSIGDDVEIGANVTIDQGTIRATQIGSGSKLDNQVHIGHNVIVGAHCLLCGQVGIAGSTVLGDFCVMGGQAGAADNITIGSNAIIGAGSGVLSNVPKGKAMMGYPAVAMQTHIDMYKSLRRLPRVLKGLSGKKNT